MRLVVVLGYSDRRQEGLHPICAARLQAAAAVARDDDVVLLSGKPEAAAMLATWTGRSRVLTDHEARNTAESALHAARVVRDLNANEVVVVTSWWHRRRAGFLFRVILRGSGVRVHTVRAPVWTVRLLARELGALALAPVQLRRGRT